MPTQSARPVLVWLVAPGVRTNLPCCHECSMRAYFSAVPVRPTLLLIAILLTGIRPLVLHGQVRYPPPSVTPVGGALQAPANTTGLSASFTVHNNDTTDKVINWACSRSGGVTSCSSSSSHLIGGGG